ncbi:MAG TPA: hypothetical protein VEC76_20940 [Streptosporangiaceae bacterium]|nr:hypothetical protein [Streptosporangiaceae bacterium]
MHPVITQTIAAERIRELHTDAAAVVRARRVRRSRRTGVVTRIARAIRGPVSLPLHGPRAA